MIIGLLAGPAVGFIAKAYDFQTVIHVASAVALTYPTCALGLLLGRFRFEHPPFDILRYPGIFIRFLVIAILSEVMQHALHVFDITTVRMGM